MSRVATAPISWGVCEVPGWGHQLGPDRVLSEMHQLGFTNTELGSAGWLPESNAELQETLLRHQLSLLAAFIPLVLHDSAQAEAALHEADGAAKLLSDNGALFFNTAPVTSADWKPRFELSDSQWIHLFEMIENVDRICIDRGLTQVIHSHFGCVVETAAEVQALLDNTDVALVLDTGHLAIGGYSPIDLIKQYPDRVGLVHLKDTNLEIVKRLNSAEVTLMEAVQAGLFTALGEGDLDLSELITTLEASGYDGWYVIEQDCAITGALPGEGQGPMLEVETSVKFLNELAAAL